MKTNNFKMMSRWILSISILMLCSCTSSESVNGNAHMSECLQDTNRSNGSFTESIRCSMQNNNILMFRHLNRMVACDAEACDITIKIEGNTVYINEEVKAKGELNCLCPVNIEYAINQLEYKSYIVKVMSAKEILTQFELTVNENCDVTHIVHEWGKAKE